MDRGRPIVLATHLLLASVVAIVAVIGIFGGSGRPADGGGSVGIAVVGGLSFALLIVLPLAGAVSFGLADWQRGRGATILRMADVAVFVLGVLELSLGVTGYGRWLAGSIALLAASGLAGSVLVSAPRRPGFRL